MQEIVLAEQQVPPLLDLAAPPGPDRPLPLRILTDFAILNEDGSQASLMGLASGTMSGLEKAFCIAGLSTISL